MKKIIRKISWIIIIICMVMLILNLIVDNTTLYWSGIAMSLIGILGVLYTDEKGMHRLGDLLDLFWIFD